MIGSAASEGAPFVARRAMDPHGCAPVSRDPFPQIPAFEGRCIRSLPVPLDAISSFGGTLFFIRR